jgi:serine/threonine protein kinase
MLIPGTRLGPYEVQAAIGAGGMGEVYRARDTKLHRDIALRPDGTVKMLDFGLAKALEPVGVMQIVLNWTEELKRLVPPR